MLDTLVVMLSTRHRLIMSICASFIVILMLQCTISNGRLWEAFHDTLINERYIGLNYGLDASPSGPVIQTLGYMKQVNVTFLGLGKNTGQSLPSILQQIEKLGGLFREYQLVFVDGQSSDNTKSIFDEYIAYSLAKDIKFVSVSSENLVETSGIFIGKPLPREGRIAIARNVGLDEMNKMASTDYVIMIDVDILGWSINEVVNSFAQKVEWDVICANGIMFNGIYRDTYAYRSPGVDTNHHWIGRTFVMPITILSLFFTIFAYMHTYQTHI